MSPHRSRLEGRPSLTVLSALVTLGLVVGACGQMPNGTRVSTKATTQAPTTDSSALPPAGADVSAHRFVRWSVLDRGALVVAPPPPTAKPAIGFGRARALFRADQAVAGVHQQAFLGFGLVSVASSLTAKRYPALERTPAWIGIAWGGVTSCPALAAPALPAPSSPPSHGSTASSTPSGAGAPAGKSGSAPTPGYTAVIILARGRTVLAYQSRGGSCGGPVTGPTLTAAPETVSVPWRLVSISGDTVTYRYQVPACATGTVRPHVRGSGNTRTGDATMTVDLQLAYRDAGCPTTWRTGTAGFGPQPLPHSPGSPGPTLPPMAPLRHVSHGPTGPVPLLQVDLVHPGSGPPASTGPVPVSAG